MNTQHGEVDATAGLGRVTTFEAAREIPADARVIAFEDLPEIPPVATRWSRGRRTKVEGEADDEAVE